MFVLSTFFAFFALSSLAIQALSASVAMRDVHGTSVNRKHAARDNVYIQTGVLPSDVNINEFELISPSELAGYESEIIADIATLLGQLAGRTLVTGQTAFQSQSLSGDDYEISPVEAMYLINSNSAAFTSFQEAVNADNGLTTSLAGDIYGQMVNNGVGGCCFYLYGPDGGWSGNMAFVVSRNPALQYILPLLTGNC